MHAYVIETQSGCLVATTDCPVAGKVLLDALPAAWRLVRASDGVVLAEHTASRHRHERELAAVGAA